MAPMTTARRTRDLGVCAVALALVAGACSDGGDGALRRTGGGAVGTVTLADAVLASLTRMESCDDATTRLRQAAVASVETSGWAGLGFGGLATTGGVAVPQAATREAAADDGAAIGEGTGAAGGGDSADVFSTTNVQEEGVDEPDVVKTDGRTIFTLRDNTVRVIDAAALDELATIAGPDDGSVWFANLLLHGEVLLVIGEGSGTHEVVGGVGEATADERRADEGIRPVEPGIWRPRTVLARYDVSNPSAPALVDRTVVDGSVVSSRLIDGVARVVTNDGGAGGIPVPEPLASESAETFQDRLVDAVQEAPIDAFLPAYTVVDAAGEVVDDGTAVPCDQVFAPEYQTGPSTLTVHTLDLDGEYEPSAGVSVLAGGQTVYASAETLYVATSRFSGGNPVFFGGAVDAVVDLAEPSVADAPEGGAPEIVAELPAESDEPPAPTEPASPPEPPTVTTEVHAFDIGGDGAAGYLGSGQVTGTVLNQFSMSEHDGILRIATTDDGWNLPESQSYVTTLRQDGGELVQVGQVGGLGRGERIYAVRFIGTTGYVVTFRQVDPLYTLDLSDPANPTVLGELKIEGYSAYLHPTSPGRLLGLGQDATLEGRRLGTQMSLFDVSDLSDPTRLSQVGFGAGGESTAEYDHHAFLWWAPADLVVVPFQQWTFDAATGRDGGFAGAVLVRVDGDRLAEVARISHRAADASTDDLWRAAIERSLVIGDRLITISGLGLAAHDLDTLAEVDVLRYQG